MLSYYILYFISERAVLFLFVVRHMVFNYRAFALSYLVSE